MMRFLSPALLFSILAATVSAEAVTDARPVEAKPVSVSLFKNGYGLVTSRVELDGGGRYLVTPLPRASMGTFWLRWPDGVEVTRAATVHASTSERVKATSLSQTLEANLGRMVQLELSGGSGAARIEGRLRDYPLIPGTETGERGSVIVLETEGRAAIIPTGSITRLFILGEDPILETDIVKREPALSIDVETRSGNAAIEIDALTQGIAWAPSYSVDITGDKNEAILTAKAVIVNDLTDLEGVSAELIAGFPHLQFSPVPSAMSPTPLDQLLQRLRRGETAGASGVMSNVIQQRASFESADSAVPSMPSTPLMGEQSEDLYFYQVEDVTLDKGERGYYVLFQGTVPFQHRYTWDIPTFIGAYDSYRPQPLQEERQEIVWHVLKLTNTTDRPWTTAPASTTKSGRMLGQDTLHYTPPGRSTDLRITQALAVESEQNEYEVDRQREAARFYGQRYDLVTFRGELAVINHTGRTITLEITKRITGELQRADGEPETVKLASALRGVNPATRLTWTLDIEPGRDGGVKLEYTFQAYVRN